MAEKQKKERIDPLLAYIYEELLIAQGLHPYYHDYPQTDTLLLNGMGGMGVKKILEINTERRIDDMATKKEVNDGLKKVVPHIDNVFRGGQRIIIPEGMTTENAIKLLDEVQEAEDYDDDTENISDVIKVFPWDGAIALSEALKEVFGASLQKKGFLGNAQQISIETGLNESILVPWGRFNLPGTDGATISTGSTIDDGQYVFSLYASDVPRKQQEKVRKLIARTREISSKKSIYKGKAIEMKFKDEKGNRLGIPSIKFIDTVGAEPIFRRSLEEAIENFILTPIYYPETLLAIGEKLKRGILLAGYYGTGKTLLATKIASVAVQFGWTFIYVKDTTEFTYAFNFARQQQPAVVFGEDIDRLAVLQRTEQVNELLNTLGAW